MRLLTPVAIGLLLAVAAHAACSAIDPVPPHPHGDSGEEVDLLSNAPDGGALDADVSDGGTVDGGEEAGP